jgi:hypothetical protein
MISHGFWKFSFINFCAHFMSKGCWWLYNEFKLLPSWDDRTFIVAFSKLGAFSIFSPNSLFNLSHCIDERVKTQVIHLPPLRGPYCPLVWIQLWVCTLGVASYLDGGSFLLFLHFPFWMDAFFFIKFGGVSSLLFKLQDNEKKHWILYICNFRCR